MFRNEKLDAIEVGNPTLYRLLIDDRGKLRVPGRLESHDVQQVRLLIYNETAIARGLKKNHKEVRQWILAVPAQLSIPAIARAFRPLTKPLATSYFPAHSLNYRRPTLSTAVPSFRGQLRIITENDPYSDAIAASIPEELGGVRIKYTGLEKSVLVSRLIKGNYDIASITLEAMMNHPVYWRSFFTPGSPFTVFGKPLQAIRTSRPNLQTRLANAQLVDTHGNWLILFQERRYYAFQPSVVGEMYLATGLINYASIRK